MESTNQPLILIPTDFERQRIQNVCGGKQFQCPVALCGFGPIAAAAKTMQLIACYRPSQIVLVGIAGTYHAFTGAHPVATAASFQHVLCDGVGVGHGNHFLSAAAMGWSQWAGDGSASDPDAETFIGDRIACNPTGAAPSGDQRDGLLTVCGAAADTEMAKHRSQAYSTAAGEDMEAFGVAMACRMQAVKFQVIRGFSNLAGDRKQTNWRVDDALSAAAELLGQQTGLLE